jgi:hypothetical protein
MLIRTQHGAILEILGPYLHDGQYFVISPFLDVSLAEIIAYPILPLEEQIALIFCIINRFYRRPNAPC